MEKFNKFLKEYICSINNSDYDFIIDHVSKEDTFILVTYTPVYYGMKEETSETINISCMELLIFLIFLINKKY